MDHNFRASAFNQADLEQRTASVHKIEPCPEDHVGRLFAEATREWHALAESLYDLKQALEPDDFHLALAHLEIPSLEVITKAWEKAQAECDNAADSPSPPHDTANRSSDIEEGAAVEAPEHGPGPEFHDTKSTPSTMPVKEPETPSPPATDTNETATESEEITPEKSTDIRERLAELASLVREHIAKSSAEAKDTTSSLEIPKQLTLTIAREVAGQVKASVLETLRTSGVGAAGGESDAVRRSSADPRSGPKRIPLEDVEAMIDQLTRLY